MDFVQYISTPANTYTAESPLITKVRLTRGRLTGGAVYFPSGPAGKLHFLARIGIHQIIPFNTGQNLRLDNCVLPLSIGIDLDEPPFEIDLVTWNDSIEYAHALTVCLALQPRWKKGKKLGEMLAEMEAKQKTEITETEPPGGRFKP